MRKFLKKWLANYSRAQWARLLFVSLGFCAVLLSPRLFLVRPGVIETERRLAMVNAQLYMIDRMEKELASLLPKYEEAKRRKDVKETERIAAKLRGLNVSISLRRSRALGEESKESIEHSLKFVKRLNVSLNGLFYLSVALSILAFFFLFIKRKKRPRGLGRPVTEEVEHRLKGGVSRSLWVGWPALFALSIAVFIVIAFDSFGKEFLAAALAACGVLTIISGFALPGRIEEAFASESWRFAETAIARTVRKIFWGIGADVFGVLGQSAIVLEERGKLSLSWRKLLRHNFAAVMIGILLLSLPGLYIRSFARLKAATPILVWLLPVLAGILFLWLIILRPLLSFSGTRRVTCLQCGQKQPPFRLPISFKESFFNQRRCRNCGCIMNSRGKKVSYSGRVPFKTIVKPFAVSSLATIIAVVSGVVIAAVLWNFAGRVALDKAKEDLRRAGFKFVLPAAKPKLPDEDNAAFWFLRAGESESLKSFDEKFYKKKTQREFVESFLSRASRGDVLKEEILQARILIRRHKKALGLVQKGASKKAVDWGIDWNQSWGKIELPKYGYLMTIARILACKAVVEAWQGKAKQAALSVRDGLFLADSVGSEPLIFSHLLSEVLYSIALDGACFVLMRVPTSLARKVWEQHLEPEEFLNRFYRAARIDSLLQVELASRLSWRDWRKENKEIGNSWITFYWPFLKLDIASAYLGIKAVLEAIRLPYPKFEPSWEKAYSEIQKRVWGLGELWVPRLNHLYVRTLVAVARLRLAKMAIEVQLFRQKRGRWPDSLEELDYGIAKKDYLEDPFTGSRFRIEKFQRGVMIYSVGPDGVDDQGAFWDPTKESGDLVWFLR